MRKTKITNRRLKMIIREELIRQALQQGILMERPFQGEPLSDFTDAVVQGAATTAVDQNATEEERKAAQAFMKQRAEDSKVVMAAIKKAAIKWNKTKISNYIIKVPGLEGAEGYDWSEFFVDLGIIVSSGVVGHLAGRKIFKAMANTSRGARIAAATTIKTAEKFGDRGGAIAMKLLAGAGIFSASQSAEIPAKAAGRYIKKKTGMDHRDQVLRKEQSAMIKKAMDDLANKPELVVELTPGQVLAIIDKLEAAGKKPIKSEEKLAKLRKDLEKLTGKADKK
jgi:hypothetical protein